MRACQLHNYEYTNLADYAATVTGAHSCSPALTAEVRENTDLHHLPFVCHSQELN